MKFKLKDFLKTPTSTITFEEKDGVFQIEDYAAFQLWLLRVILITQLTYASTALYNSNELVYFHLVLIVLSAILLLLSFFFNATGSRIPSGSISYIAYRKGNSKSTLLIKLRGYRFRNLYLYHQEDVQETVTLFRQKGVRIKEKSLWLS